MVYVLIRRIFVRSAQNVTENVNLDAGAKPSTQRSPTYVVATVDGCLTFGLREQVHLHFSTDY